jgi:Tol biopolymer transport system component
MPATMAVSPGTRFGACTVTEVIGAGGMGEVYRALDTTLDREVAIKVLPDTFASDADRVARFQREAKVLASLNHANIAQIYGLERGAGTIALVMELVEGPTLADRLEAGPLPTDEALHVALQIVDALEAAHAHGIVHRDLKPANIKLKADGTVKVLDFGIAKALVSPVTISGRPLGVLATPAMTEIGMILGTAAYMSPEQARGRPVDQRADIWAFGCVLYEMLTGQRAFAGDDVATTLAKIFERDADPASLPSVVSPAVRRTLRLCLQKDVKERIADIRDVRLALRGVFESETPRQSRAPWLVAAAALAVVAAAAGWLVKPGGAPPEPAARPGVMRLQASLGAGQRLSGLPGPLEQQDFALQRPSRPALAISPDGRTLVYAATDGQATRLYRRRLDEQAASVIPGTEGAWRPVVSPDSRSVAFTVGSELKRVPLDGGEARTIALSGVALTEAAVADWTADDTILVEDASGIYEVSANGGAVERRTETSRPGEPFHRYPQLLPQRRGLLYTVASGVAPSDGVIAVQPLDGAPRKVVIEGSSHARYLPSGHIGFARDGALWAVAFDLERLETVGAPAIVVEDVMQAERSGAGGLNTGAAQFVVSVGGTLAYAAGGVYPDVGTALEWVDHAGNAEPLPLPPANYVYPRVSPDGTRLAYVIGDPGAAQLWVYDLEHGVPLQLTSDGDNLAPVWSPDGTRLAFFRGGDAEGPGMFWMPADGGTPQRLGVPGGRAQFPSSWSSDDVLAFVTRGGANDAIGVWTVQIGGASSPEVFFQAGMDAESPTFSPDGKWLAYSTYGATTPAGSAPPDIYVRPFPEGVPVQRISADGGWAPAWSSDGRRLFYKTREPGAGVETQRWMIVDVTTEPTFTRSRARPLFTGTYLETGAVKNHDVAANAERFLVVRRLESTPQPVTRIELVVNWFEELAERVPVSSMQ